MHDHPPADHDSRYGVILCACGAELDCVCHEVKVPFGRHVRITGAWLRRIGDRVELLLEIGGTWFVVAGEHYDASFSHIVDIDGIRKAEPDWLGDWAKYHAEAPK